MSESWRESCQQAANVLRRARRAVAFTGAGISVPSGIPDFRSKGGLWSKYDPVEVASLQAMTSNPAGVWRFLVDTAIMFHPARPNSAHIALAELERKGYIAGVLTQNIDGLHQQAGSETVVEYHGGWDNWYCRRCYKGWDHSRAHELTPGELPVRCECGGLIRPPVVFFGEGIPQDALRESDRLLSGTDVLLIVGTSGEVTPANTLPRRVKNAGGTVIEINLGRTWYEGVSDIRVDASAERALPVLYDLVVS
ncbi:SIR2 family NAD-dependent protein deacylase [Desulfovibrio ferrophilus]|uniref:protein acetyllysine N-acetyltransferase n=1 Tax=Desulfovibrio ferrophilus TaxID=241368 RepID=A0A2Z6AYL6_9BACT|nr:NAD-dependent deacylase [Desulfovibrio ferrophilus]BBD08339.1 NAD-dependent deacetylase [Desulfovibrio ferrophilus]